MGLLDVTKRLKLDNLKASVLKKTGFESFNKVVNNVNLNNISLDNLKSLVDTRFTQGLDWDSLDLSSMDSDLLNSLAPGCLDVSKLKKKLSNVSLLKGKITELVDTQSGTMAIGSEVRVNGDVEDIISAKAISQGTNMQMANRAAAIKYESSSRKSIPSNFVGKESVV